MALDRRYKKLEKSLNRKIYKILDFLKQERVRVEVYLVGSLMMRRLNRQYGGQNEITNILSFGIPRGFAQPSGGTRSLGEIYLCPSYIKRQEEDIADLLIHGLLHLIGFNHAAKNDRIIMEKMERKILTWLKR